MMIGGSGGCFPKGALVQLEGGNTKRIEDVKLGDEVLSFDEWGNITKSVVTETHFHAEPEPLITVKYWQGEITITPNHWVLNAIKTFSAIGDLGINEALVDGFGNLRPIVSIKRTDPEPVYNLTVEPYHTFICDGICVHNGGYRASYPTIGGSGGGGKKKKKSEGMKEDPDSLQSTSKISVLDLIGEGEIGGLVYSDKTVVYNGEKRPKSAMSIFLDDTPLMASDGSWNFEGVSFGSRNGTQSQSPIAGFNDVESTESVGIEVTKKGGGIIKTITNPNADQVRVVVSVSALTKTDNTNGNIHGSSVSYKFEVQHVVSDNNSSDWITLGTHIITGKTRSTYQRAHLYSLPKSASNEIGNGSSWNIRMTRLTDDSESSLISDKLSWDSFSIIINSRLNYPNSALVGVTLDAEQFSSVPSRSYLVKGLKIKVPSNYSPPYRDDLTLTGASVAGWHPAVYSGIWNGSFKTMVSSNPAWILYDLLTDTRYGLGKFITKEDIDIGKLYKIGKYCDELVPSGYGDESGKAFLEPRFQINTVIQQRTDAYKVISDICSAFRGMAFWSGGEIGIMADMPTLPSMKYTPANVIDGMFTYQGSARKDRHSVALVTWNNPDQYYQQEIEYVEDPEMVDKYGIKETEIVDFGCTSRGQARRAGLWLLYTEKYESDLITFEVGIDSSLVLPGDVIEIHDTVRAGKRFGGRIKSASKTYAEIDSEIQYDNNTVFSVRLPDGSFAEREVTEYDENTNKIYWEKPLPKVPMANAIWLCSSGILEPVVARVVAIKQKTSSTYTISALEHNPSKYDAIEKGLALDVLNTSILDFNKVNNVTNLEVTEILYQVASGANGTKLFVSWTGDASSYIVSYRRKSSESIERLIKTDVVSLSGLNTISESNVTMTTTVKTTLNGSDGFTVNKTVTTINNDNGKVTTEKEDNSYQFGTTVSVVGDTVYETTAKHVYTVNNVEYAVGSEITVDEETGNVTVTEVVANMTEDGLMLTVSSITRDGNYEIVNSSERTIEAGNGYTEEYVVTVIKDDGSDNPSTTVKRYGIGETSSTITTDVITREVSSIEIADEDEFVLTKTVVITDKRTNKEISRSETSTVYNTDAENITTGIDEENNKPYTDTTIVRVVTNAESGEITGYAIETRRRYEEMEIVDNWITVTTTLPSYEIMNAQSGEYEIRVQAVSLNGNKSQPVSVVHKVVGAVAVPGTPIDFNVRKRTFDLLCSWHEVTDISVTGYEVRVSKDGGGWDRAQIIQANIQATACVDDKDEAGIYFYYLKSINTDGVYCVEPAVFRLELKTPQAVTGFVCVRNNDRIEFRWEKNPETDVVYYEIREGSSWAVSSLVVQTDATAHTIPASGIGVEKTYWIKACASPGIYSNIAVMANLTSKPSYMNILYEHDEASKENDWHGVHFNTKKVPNSTILTDYKLMFEDGKMYGDYIHKITLPQRYNETNSIDAVYQVLEKDDLRWSDANFAWKSNDAKRPWVLTGDLNVCHLEHQISLFRGYDQIKTLNSAVIEAFPLESDAKGKVSNLNSNKIENVSYGVGGRFHNGAVINKDSVLNWVKSYQGEFFVHFWYTFTGEGATGQKSVVFQIRFNNDVILDIGLNSYHQTFYVESSNAGNGEIIEIYDYFPEVGDKILFGLIQEQNSRTLCVGRVGYEPKSATDVSRVAYVNSGGQEFRDPVIKIVDGTTIYTDTDDNQLEVRNYNFGNPGSIKKFGFGGMEDD